MVSEISYDNINSNKEKDQLSQYFENVQDESLCIYLHIKYIKVEFNHSRANKR